MLSSNSTQVIIQYFLNLIKAESSEIVSNMFMTDRVYAQVNSIQVVFPECCHIFYCWWHVLRAIHTHFNTKEFLELWSCIQDWVCVTDENEFNVCWKYIKEDTLVSKSMTEYIAWDWLSYKEMWSIMSCQNWMIFEKGDTNMLLEA